MTVGRVALLATAALAAACAPAPDQAGRAASRMEGDATAASAGRIVFVSDRVTGSGYNLEIFSMKADGSDQSRLTDNPGHDHQPAWSPDRSEIAFASGQPDSDMTAILLMKADGSEPRTLTEGWVHVGVPRWSPDGDQIAVAGDRGDGTQIYLIDVATGDLTKITDEPDPTGVGGAYQPDWSPDGRRIVHMRIRFDDRQESSSQLYVMNADGSDVTLLPTGASTESGPRWSPDGGKVAFVTGRDGATEIYVMNIDGSNVKPVTDHPGDDFTPTWSPDGTHLAFASSRDGDAEIYVASYVGTEMIQLTENAWDDTNPDWISAEPAEESSAAPSPDQSKYIGFYPGSRMENGQIVMPLVFVDGSSAEVVAPPELGVQDMSATIFTSAGLGGVDRTINFRYGNPYGFTHEGPLQTYESHDGSAVEVWKGTPGDWECPNLVFRFGDWYVGVRTCQGELSVREKERWARSLRGEVTHDGFLVLSGDPPLVLQETGGHEGPQMYLGMDRANWIQLMPGSCDPETYANDGDIRITADGTRVSFNRLQDGNSGIEYDWFVSWCEDGLVRVQVEYAYENFAKSAAEGFRLRNIVLAQ